MLPALVARGDAIPLTVDPQPEVPPPRAKVLRLVLRHRQSPARWSCNPERGAVLQELPARIILSREIADRCVNGGGISSRSVQTRGPGHTVSKGASPSQGVGGGNDGGSGGGAGDDAPADEPPGDDDPMGGNNADGGGPSLPGSGDPDEPGFGPESEYFAPAASADACIVVHFLHRRAGLSPAVAAWRNGA